MHRPGRISAAKATSSFVQANPGRGFFCGRGFFLGPDGHNEGRVALLEEELSFTHYAPENKSLNRVYTRAFAGVRFYAEDLDPLDVTMRLRLPADATHRVGEPRLNRTKSGDVREYAPYREGMWRMSSRQWVKSPRLSTHIDWLLSELEPKAEEVHGLLKRGIKGDIFCFSEGKTESSPSLPKRIRERADALGLEIVIDHYDIVEEEGAEQAPQQ
jgi:hypothetical protein